jgi:hypothetical protein
LQQSPEVSFFGAKRREPAPDCDTDLQAMVHDFIENDCAEDGADGIDGASPGATLSETLQVCSIIQSHLLSHPKIGRKSYSEQSLILSHG